ncbi:MAG: hypothetical protein LUD77_11140 [Clostridiales bacterium]|nr:hypothetical protein [Clostridiales bacterium]
MVNDFIKGAAAALKGFGYPVYIEEIPMNFERPCFTVKAESVKTEPYLSRYFKETITLGTELYMSEGESSSESYEEGRNYRLAEIEAGVYEALRFIAADGRIYCAKSINSQRKSQVTSGNTPSNVEGLGAILYVKAEYSRFVRKSVTEDESGFMEELYDNYYLQ